MLVSMLGELWKVSIEAPKQMTHYVTTQWHKHDSVPVTAVMSVTKKFSHAVMH